MTVSFFILIGVLAVLAVYAVGIYNGLVRLKHNVGKSWSNIDVLLKQRHDELPKLVEVCRQYAKFEKETLEKVMAARSAVSSAQQSMDIPALGAAETQLRAGLGRLFAVAEAYPDLKANQSFAQLASRISHLENAIADRREFYNESVNQNNIRLESFPDSLVAAWGRFKTYDLLSFTEEELKDVDLKQLFSA